MKKRVGRFILLMFLLAFLSSEIFAAVTAINPGHNSEQVYIQLSGKYVTLQRAIDSSSLGSISSYDSLPITTPYHLANQVLITKDNYKMTLQEAIDNGVFRLGATQSYTTILPAGGEYAESINVSTTGGIMNLQNAINQGRLSHIFVCVSNFGQSCFPSGTDASCVNLGITQCDGSCLGASYKSKATSCAGDDWHSCDGQGHCVGWSGTGCGSCPFGKYKYITNYACYNPNNFYQGTWYNDYRDFWNPWGYYNIAAICKWSGDDRLWKMKP
mgnify:CR=1 FL=1